MIASFAAPCCHATTLGKLFTPTRLAGRGGLTVAQRTWLRCEKTITLPAVTFIATGW